MKEIKLIEDLSELEFEDLMYLKTDMETNRTGLNYKFSSISNPYFNKNIPHILIFKDSKMNYLNYKNYSDYSTIKISSNPYTIRNNLNLSDEDLNHIFEFIKMNKQILMRYWNWKCSSNELKTNIRRINESI